MRVIPLFLMTFLLVAPAAAATYQYNLRFEGDSVRELQTGLTSEPCVPGQGCYPSGFRLANGKFADLSVGQKVTATINFDAGTGTMNGWSIPGFLTGVSPDDASFVSLTSLSVLAFNGSTVEFASEGPAGANPSGRCDPSRPMPGLPDGFCGFYGYTAKFAVESMTPVPLPASGLLLLGGLAYLGFRRMRRRA